MWTAWFIILDSNVHLEDYARWDISKEKHSRVVYSCKSFISFWGNVLHVIFVLYAFFRQKLQYITYFLVEIRECIFRTIWIIVGIPKTSKSSFLLSPSLLALTGMQRKVENASTLDPRPHMLEADLQPRDTRKVFKCDLQKTSIWAI